MSAASADVVVDPAALAAHETFALLGPGYGAGRWLLLTGLTEDAAAPDLVYAPFEAPGRDARRFAAARRVRARVALAPLAGRPAVVLRDDGYREAVSRIHDAIAAGDVYQVCHTIRARVQGIDGAGLLAAMCRPAVPRFAAWVRLPGGAEFVSASPELFFETRGRRVHAEPMKGTAGRGGEGALEASAKDRAELAMITDLLRNDLTPVCRPRTVRVRCARRAIRLPYAIQTVSDVVGTLADGVSPLEALAALHPGGSVTGAPKAAALAMIRRLEEEPRGAYCGALGLCSGSRSVFGLLIRTASRTADGWTYGVGGGVVWDSNAGSELAEIHVKLGALWGATPSC